MCINATCAAKGYEMSKDLYNRNRCTQKVVEEKNKQTSDTNSQNRSDKIKTAAKKRLKGVGLGLAQSGYHGFRLVTRSLTTGRKTVIVVSDVLQCLFWVGMKKNCGKKLLFDVNSWGSSVGQLVCTPFQILGALGASAVAIATPEGARKLREAGYEFDVKADKLDLDLAKSVDFERFSHYDSGKEDIDEDLKVKLNKKNIEYQSIRDKKKNTA